MMARLRPGLGRRLLWGLAIIALYGIAAAALAALVPDTGWPTIGAGRYSSQQATIVPAVNFFAVASLVLVVAAPLIARAAVVAFGLVAAVFASAVGPLLAVFEGGADLALLTPGTIALAVAGSAIGLLQDWFFLRVALPAR